MRLGKVRGDKRIITLEPMNGFQRFKKGNCSEFDGPSIQSTAKAPKWVLRAENRRKRLSPLKIYSFQQPFPQHFICRTCWYYRLRYLLSNEPLVMNIWQIPSLRENFVLWGCLLNFLTEVVFIFGWGHFHFLGEVVFCFWVKSSSILCEVVIQWYTDTYTQWYTGTHIHNDTYWHWLCWEGSG